MKLNPFKPGSIVGPEAFAGRYTELRALDQGLFQTKNGNPWHFLIHGERGIGKSSLLLVTEMIAEGKVPTVEDNLVFNFIVTTVTLETGDTYQDIIAKISRELTTELSKREQLKATLKTVWDFISKWDVLGVKYTNSSPAPQKSELLDGIVERFATANERLDNQIDGFLILIDEADAKTCASSDLGQFIKLFTESLTRRGCNRVSVGIAGLSEAIDGLKASHQSSVRILHHMLLEPLPVNERLQVLSHGIAQANKVSTHKIVMRSSAAQKISQLSEGYPHFIQQYASSAFDVDNDNDITDDDVAVGAYAENGALDQLGARYFEGMYADEIDSDDYRKVLKVMAADTSVEYMTRKQIKAISGLKETTLTNALAALSRRHIILKHREISGLYKLPSGSFGAWIMARVSKEQQKLLTNPFVDPSSQQG